MILGDKDAVLSRIVIPDSLFCLRVVVLGDGKKIQVAGIASIAIGVSRCSRAVAVSCVTVEVAEINVRRALDKAGLQPETKND